ncbi:RPM1-interacting protein 4-like isoform X2 [Salvia miltiorrhiza]|uniref:RPM1-interacting protein 4-like isoform X2 n=1 Tax=Salvia miltiorrhiza TaxID=226208 RepID=UPI0025ABB406|nr:RPM1-interacting protein 4-like isoform X2 [Salvia miltiorrhiza]
MARSQVPQFGNWETEEIPYTMYFDNARKDKKSGQIYQINLDDSVEAELKDQKASEEKKPKHERPSSREEGEVRKSTGSPNVVNHIPANDSSYKRRNNSSQSGSDKLEVEALKPIEIYRPRHDRRSSREDGEMRRLTDSPLRHETAGRRNSSNSPHHRYGGSSAGDTPKRHARNSVGSDRSTDHSPLHPHSQARVGGKSIGVSSPSSERKATSDGSQSLAPSTPGRSRLRSVTRGDDSPDRSPAVPKFGDWDETDPAAAEGYTQVFNRVREEKNSETGKVPVMPTETSNSSTQKQANENTKGCFCFSWTRR